MQCSACLVTAGIPCINMCLTAGEAGREEEDKQMQTFIMLRVGYGDANNNRAKQPVTVPGCHRPPSSSYFKACSPLGADVVLGQPGKRQHNQSKQAA